MARPSVDVKLYGDKADLFRAIQDYLEEKKGYRPNNADTVAEMMALFNQEEL